MEYKIIGQTVPAVEMTLRQGEVVYTPIFDTLRKKY